MIIDTHVHIWDLDKSAYRWLEGAGEVLQRTFDLGMLEAERVASGISGGILVQADNTAEDTRLMLDTAAAHDWIKGVVGWLPLMDPEKTGALLQSWVAGEKYFKGVRHLIHDEADDEWLLQAEVIESLKLLAVYALPYDIVGIKPAHIKTALRVAELVPDLKMVFDHLNQPPIQNGKTFGAWGDYMRMAAQHSNFYVKISGLSTTAGVGMFNADHMKPYIDFILGAFGADRCFCGGDWPVSLLAGSYADTWKVYQQVIKDLVPDISGQQQILSGNAITFYNLGK